MTRMIFNAAIRKKKIRFNPAQEVELPTVIKKKAQPPSKADVLKVLEQSSPEEKTIFLLDAMTGLRHGEVLALQWRDIDWLSHEMIVQRAIC